MYYVYVIQNENRKIYIGQTDNLENRLKRHNGALSAKVRSYTKINKGIWQVIYREEVEFRTDALKREKYLKSHIGRDWIRKNIMGR